MQIWDLHRCKEVGSPLDKGVASEETKIHFLLLSYLLLTSSKKLGAQKLGNTLYAKGCLARQS